MIVRPAISADAPGFHALARAYIAESGQRRAYSEANTQAALEHGIRDPGTLLLLAEEIDLVLVGGVMATLDYAFTEQPVCGVGMFYVRPEWRGTPVARALISGAVQWADEAGCSHCFTSGDAMIGDADTQMFINLVRKFGFEPTGSPVLVRRKP